MSVNSKGFLCLFLFDSHMYWYVCVLVGVTSALSKHQSLTSISSSSETTIASASKTNHTYVPDFTLKATSNLQIMKIKHNVYIAARKATMMERQSIDTQDVSASLPAASNQTDSRRPSTDTYITSGNGRKSPVTASLTKSTENVNTESPLMKPDPDQNVV